MYNTQVFTPGGHLLSTGSLANNLATRAAKKSTNPRSSLSIDEESNKPNKQELDLPQNVQNALEGIEDIQQLQTVIEKDELLKSINVEIEEKAQPKLTQEEANKILKTYAMKTGVSFPLASLAAAILIQLGGTNASNNNIKCKLAGKEFHIKELREAIAFTNKKATVRQLARTLSKTIISIAGLNNIPGVLAKTLENENPELEFTIQEQIYASEWNLENPDCPDRIRKLLAERAKQKKEQKQKPTTKKPQRKGGK
jgi:hypothetical protein